MGRASRTFHSITSSTPSTAYLFTWPTTVGFMGLALWTCCTPSSWEFLSTSLRDIFFDQLGKTSRAAKVINGLSKVFMKQFAHQSKKSMPPMRFSKGTQEGKLMGRDYRGVLLLMMVLCQTSASRSVIKASRGGKKTRGNFKEENLINDWADLLELLLLWEAYLHLPEMETKDLRKLDRKQRYLMYLMRMVAHRDNKMGLKLVKFHNILHIVDNVTLYGVPLESDTRVTTSPRNRRRGSPNRPTPPSTNRLQDVWLILRR